MTLSPFHQTSPPYRQATDGAGEGGWWAEGAGGVVTEKLTNFPDSPVRIFAARQSAGEVGIVTGKGFPKLILPHLIKKLTGRRNHCFV